MPYQGLVRPSAILISAFAGLCLAASGIIYITYSQEAEHRRTAALHELSSIVDFKVNILGNWLNERRANAWSASQVPAVADDLKSWISQAENQTKARERLSGFLHNLQKFYGFISVELLDLAGTELLLIGDAHHHSQELLGAIGQQKLNPEARLVDIHRHGNDQVRLGFLAPIFDTQAKETLLGMLFFELDVREHLYPLLERWAGQIQSIEIGLMRPEGQDIVFLSPMKHQPEALLTRRQVPEAPTILKDLVMTADTKPYSGQSIDYRGTRVLVAGAPVPGTNWQLLVKMDEDEAMEGLMALLINASVLAALALLTTFSLLGLWWQRQHLQEAKARADLAQRLVESETNYRTIFNQSRLPGLVINPASGVILDANQAAVDFYGYSLEQLRTIPISAINTLSPEEIRANMRLAATNKDKHFDFRHRLATGEVRDVEVFSGPLSFNGKPQLFSLINDVTERKRLELQLREMATTDALTGLPNRRAFLAHLQEHIDLLAREVSLKASVMMLDLDRFKLVNDTLGHEAGDQVLNQIAARMREQIRKVDIPGRLGGEEFAILLPGIGPEEAMASAERLRQAMAGQPITLTDGSQISQSISIGISGILETDLDTKEPLARADKALYQAKEQGRNRTVIFDASA